MARRRAKPVRMTIQVVGVRETLRVVGKLPKVAQAEVRDASVAIAEDEAAAIVRRAGRTSRQAALAARSVRARRDRVPVIIAGGSKRLPKGRGTFGDVFFGAEFGGQGNLKRTQQFPRHKGREGYWFWPQLREDESRIFAQWGSVVRALGREWDRG